MAPRARKTSLQVAKEVNEVNEVNETFEQQETTPSPLFDVALIFHTEKGVDRIELGHLLEQQIASVMTDVSNSFNTLRVNTSFLLQDTQGEINFFNLDKVTRIQFVKKLVQGGNN